MEMLETELQLAQEASNIGVARNDMLPLLSLDYTYNIPGLGGSLNQAFGMAGNHDFEDAPRRHAPRSPHRQRGRQSAPPPRPGSRASRHWPPKNSAPPRSRRKCSTPSIRLDANWQRIIAARKSVAAAQRVVDVETRQFGQGLRTSTDVLNAQTEARQRPISEISAITDYQIAQVDIAFATGTVLGASKVIWDPTTVKK
jgi:outer membrane protein